MTAFMRVIRLFSSLYNYIFAVKQAIYLISFRTRLAVNFAQFDVALDEQVHYIGELERLEESVGYDRCTSISSIIRLLESTEQLRF